MEKILEFGHKNNIQVAIITNGVNLIEYKELLEKYKDIISLQITLDGCKEIHDKRRIRSDGNGTFEEIVKNVNGIINLNIPLNIRINIDKENMHILNVLKVSLSEHNWIENKNIKIYGSPVIDFDNSMLTSLTEGEFLEFILQENLYGQKDSLLDFIVSPIISFIMAFFNNNINPKPWKTNYCEATSGKELCFSPEGEIDTCIANIGKNKFSVGEFNEKEVILKESSMKNWTDRNIFNLEK